MSSTRGLVASSLRSSGVDGPGNRYVLFLQGCNFDCVGCHNPTTIPRYESVPDPPFGEWRAVDDVLVEVRSLRPFLSGVTVSGGEATLQLDFLVDLFGAIKADPGLRGLTTLVDTNGTLDESGWERLAPVLDGAMVDLKAWSPDLHRALTGSAPWAVHRSIRWLAARGLLAEVRLLLIEGVNDSEDELAGWASFVAGAAPGVPGRVLAFRHRGTRHAAREWPETSEAAVARGESFLAAAGMPVIGEVTTVLRAVSPTEAPEARVQPRAQPEPFPVSTQ
ncbi:MAG: radical SAM protein [Acidimicrobiia bacterium]